MFICSFCTHQTTSLRAHLLHSRYHRNASSQYPCGFDGCKYSFKKYNSLTCHLQRHHAPIKQLVTQEKIKEWHIPHIEYKCTLQICQKTVENHSMLMKHLQRHIEQGHTIKCPVVSCHKQYSKAVSFRSHVTRHKQVLQHKPNIALAPAPSSTATSTSEEKEPSTLSVNFDLSEVYEQPEEFIDDGNSDSAIGFDFDLHLRNLASLYLKLQSHFLLPASVIQYIIDEMKNVHEMGQSYIKQKLREHLLAANIDEKKTGEVLNNVFDNDPFVQAHCSKTGELRSDYKRRTFYKKHFHYVAHKEVSLGAIDGVQRHFCYVPIKNTLQALFKDKSVQNQYDNPIENTDPDILRDISDGCIFKTNPLFQEEPNALQLILYQDSFEVVNPLGSAKTKHKILAVYLSLGNIYPCSRSQLNTIQLVALCREKDFNICREKIFQPIVNDLLELETVGVEIHNSKRVRGTLICIAGDNLGSHGLGGFTENFSTSTFFCRFCTIERSQLQTCEACQNMIPCRTVAGYKSCVEELNAMSEKGESTQKLSIKGICQDSIFNKLEYYHVASPGLPPCLGHDLFEGVVQYDLAIFIQYFIKEKHWFTYQTLNKRIDTFPYTITDRRDKPSLVPPSGKRLGGQACQNWCLLRLFPLLIVDITIDAEDDVWQCVLLLQEIVEYVCAPSISKTDLCYLQQIIEEYLHLRLTLFPNKPIRPKHHYMAHYPELTLLFGPLMRVWTMRFESKHSFFKRTLRYSQNFINVCYSLGEKHQLLQAHLSNGMRLENDLELKHDSTFYIELFATDIQDAVKSAHLQQICQYSCTQIVKRGVTYKTGDILVLSQANHPYAALAKVLLILATESGTIHFVLHKINFEFVEEFHTIRFLKFDEHMCVSFDQLSDYTPLSFYEIGINKFIQIRHALRKYK